MTFHIGDVVLVTNDCDGYGYPDYVGEVGYVIGTSMKTSDGGTEEDPVIWVEFNKRILAEIEANLGVGPDVDPRMQLFSDELEVVGVVCNNFTGAWTW